MKVIIAGDYAPISSRMIEQIENDSFSEMFSDDLVSIIKDADFSLVNFESPIANVDARPIDKNGPTLRCSQKAVDAIKYAGFSGVTLANNHFLDFGYVGVENTIGACKSLNISTVGGGINLSDASKVLYEKIGSQTLAVINCCEHEFSIASETTPGSNPLDPVAQFNQIIQAHNNADYVVVVVHGGHEHHPLPSPRMKNLYRFFIDAGADAVVNHHQHCFSGYEVYKGKPIFYGLGNFAFDWDDKRDSLWNQGYLVQLDLNSVITFEIVPYEQYGVSPSVSLLKSSDIFYSDLSKLNAIIRDDKRLDELTKRYYDSRESIIKSILEPNQNRLIRSAINRHILRSMLSRQWLIKLHNIIDCESHRDILLNYLNRITRQDESIMDC